MGNLTIIIEMAYKTIEQIKVGGNTQGKAFGGFIYAANMSVGYSSSVSQLILNVISPDNNYTITDNDLAVNVAPTLIKIGDLSMNMFLYAYTKNRTPDGGTTLTVTYVDQSINLDRVFIGIANEHTRKNIQSIVLTGSIPMTCEACDGSTTPRTTTGTIYRAVESYGLNGNAGTLAVGRYGVKQSIFHYGQGSSAVPSLIITVNGTAALMQDEVGSNLNTPSAPSISGFTLLTQFTKTNIVSYYGFAPNYTNVANPAFTFGSIKEGGFIALGTEEFAQSSCAAGAMTYSLKELKAAITDFGFSIHTENGIDTIPDGYDDLRRNYSGSLRQVLQNWGNDYGFDFAYDFTENKLIGINLRNPITDLETIKDRIKNSDSLTDYTNSPIVENLEESASLAGTFRKYHSTIYRKDAKVRTYNKTIYNRATFSSLRLQDVMSSAPSGYSFDEFYTSCILATLSKNLWLWYNLIQIESISSQSVTSKANKMRMEKKGNIDPSITEVRQLTQENYRDYIENIFNAQRNIAENFLNQYYVNFQYTPTAKKYCSGQVLDIDFQASFTDQVESFYKSNGIFPNTKPAYFNIFGEEYGGLLLGVKDLSSKYLGYYGSLTVNAANFLSRNGKYFYNVNLSQLNSANKNLFHFTQLPISPDDVNNGGFQQSLEYFAVKATNISTSFTTDRINPYEVQSIATENNTVACKLLCEQDFISEICNFDRCLGAGQRTDKEWPRGLIATNNAVYGDTLRISFTPPAYSSVTPQSVSFEVTTPSYAPYQTNFVYTFNNRYVMPGAKKVLAGEIDKDTKTAADYPQNVEAVDFSTVDITGEIDTYIDNTDNSVITNVLVPTNGLMTVENYDSELRNTGQTTLSVSNLRKTFKFSVPGMLPSSFSDILTPAKGLLSFDINYDDKGLTTTYNFATRPPKPPQRDTVFTRISPNFVKR